MLFIIFQLYNSIPKFNKKNPFKGTGHFFETLSVGSVSGTDHS